MVRPPLESCPALVTAVQQSAPAILQVTPALDTGGVERTTIDVAAALVREGYVPLVASAGGRLESALRAAGGELIRLPMDSKAPHILIANAFRLRDVIAKRNVKLVHARSRAPAWSAFWAAKMSGVPFVTTYHGIYNARSAPKRFYNSVMVRGKITIANSEWTATHIQKQHHAKREDIVVIPRGIDLSQFDPGGIAPERVSTTRANWGAKPDDIVVLLPGRLTRWKGQKVLIEALEELSKTDSLTNVHAVLAGDAQGRDTYEAGLRQATADAGLNDTISVVGHVEDMATAYLAADIVVSASTEPEAFGRVAAEAGAMGKPVIATDHGGARETVLQNVSGILVPPDDAAALAKALSRMIAMGPDQRRDMGAAGRRHVVQRFTLDRMCADTIALYKQILGS
ncbi:MAG: glycosyltransferase family 4 protein [Proteobacteria bacterium]|nr:glycosyltransferase family 4 protein [Pseudomonadota bacterium]